jgi:hypothetical protein
MLTLQHNPQVQHKVLAAATHLQDMHSRAGLSLHANVRSVSAGVQRSACNAQGRATLFLCLHNPLLSL